MKLATYADGSAEKVGLVDTGRGTVLDLAAAAAAVTGAPAPALASMMALIESGPAGMDLVRKVAADAKAKGFEKPLAGLRLLAPIPVPASIRDGSVFERHIRDAPQGMNRLKARIAGQPEPPRNEGVVPQVSKDIPVYYFSNRFSVVGPEVEVKWPRYSKAMDFELEIAAIIGRKGKDIAKDKARDYVFGYTLLNDFSARDMQGKEMEGRLGPTKGKSFDMGNAMGPWIVTPDELTDPYRLKVAVRINGREHIATDMRGMLHTFEDMIAYISTDETLHPGEVIASGTVGGCCGMESDFFLSSGDTVELYADGIGTLRNRVVQQ